MRAALFAGLILCAGCAKNENNCTPSSESYTFELNKSIDTSHREVSLLSGTQTVFKFQYNYEQCDGVVGAAVSRDIYFEIPSATQNEFSYVNDLTSASALLYRVAPINPSLRMITPLAGSISGTRVSETKWHVTAVLNAGAETIRFERDFIKKE